MPVYPGAFGLSPKTLKREELLHFQSVLIAASTTSQIVHKSPRARKNERHPDAQPVCLRGSIWERKPGQQMIADDLDPVGLPRLQAMPVEI